MIKVVSFDIGGTLVQYRKADNVKKDDNLIQKFASVTGVRQNIIEEMVMEQFIKRSGDIHRFCRELGYNRPDLIKQIIAEHKSNTKASLFDDVVCTLKELKQSGLRFVAISNNFSWNESNLDFYGIGGFFELEVYSFEAGYTKPDTRIFRYVEEIIKAKPQEFIHVGDSVRSDVQGANDASWNSVLIRRQNGEMPLTSTDNTTRADFTISSMDQLTSVIHQINHNK